MSASVLSVLFILKERFIRLIFVEHNKNELVEYVGEIITQSESTDQPEEAI